jgi:uncharacterized lipoprotein YbaY
MASISGAVTYREPFRLPPGAVVEVTMADVARMDAPAQFLAATTVPAPARPPCHFTLTFDPAQLTPQGRYAVRAVIRADGRLLFTSTAHIPARDLDPDRPILLSLVGRGPGPSDARARSAP